MNEDSIEALIAWGEAQEQEELQYRRDMDSWWDELDLETRRRAVYSVVRRIHEAELVEETSYRRMIELLGLEPEDYHLGQIAGLLELHNHIVSRSEMRKLREIE